MQHRRFCGSAARLSVTIALSGALAFAGVPTVAFADPQSELDQATAQLSQIGAEYQTERLRIFSPAISLPITRPAAVSCSR